MLQDLPQNKWNLGILMTFSQVQTSEDDSWYGEVMEFSMKTRIWYFVFLCVLVIRQVDRILFLSLVSFFLSSNTTKAFFFFSPFSFLETKSTLLIQLPVADILCRGLKIHENLLLAMCLIFISIYVWFMWIYAADVIGHMYFE